MQARVWYALGFVILFGMGLVGAIAEAKLGSREAVRQWVVQHGITGPTHLLLAVGFALVFLLLTFLIATSPFPKRKR
jgi:uncharacterized membrane protein YdjX (TVP38/TMEM64 family)